MLEKLPASQQRQELHGFDYLPANVIEDILINDDITRTEDGKTSFWTHPDTLRDLAAVYSNIGDNHDVLLPQAPEMHRGVILEMIVRGPAFFDEYYTQFSQVFAKGTGLTLNGHANYKNPEHSKEIKRPDGLFGLKGAHFDTIGSNTHASEKGRTARSLGIIVLSHNKLRVWSNKLPPVGKNALNTALDTVEANKDNSVIQIRLGGVERNSEVTSLKEYNQTQGVIFDSQTLFTERGTYRKAANLLLAEINIRSLNEFNTRYRTHVTNTDLEYLYTLMNTESVANGIRVIDGLLPQFNRHNRLVAEKCQQKYPDKLMSYPLGGHNSDKAGFVYDWELNVPKRALVKNIPQSTI